MEENKISALQNQEEEIIVSAEDSKSEICVVGVLDTQNMEIETDTSAGDERGLDAEQSKVDNLTINLNACCVCRDDKASLRCPKCRHKYCNLECYQQHKHQNICKISDESVPEKCNEVSKPNTRQYFYPSKDTLPVESLELLSTGENLKKLKVMFENRNLRSVISHLNQTHNPVEEFRKIMLDEKFVEFADFILNVVQEKTNASKSTC